MVAYVLALPTPSPAGGAWGAVTGGAATAVVIAEDSAGRGIDARSR